MSPNRVLVLVANGVEWAKEKIRKYNLNSLKKPLFYDNNKIKITLTRIYEEHVRDINKDIIDNSDIGVIFKDEENVSSLEFS